MKVRWRLGLVLLFLLMSFHFLPAQDLSGRFGLGFFGSAVKMVGGDVDRSTIDQWAGLRLKYGYTPTLAFDANIGYGWIYARDPEGSQFESTGGFKTLLFPLNANLIIHTLPYSKQRPFISLGFGITQWEIRKTSGDNSLCYQGESVDGSHLNATVLAGFGFEFFVNENITAEIVFKYHRLLKGNEDTIGLGDDANNGIVEVRIAAAYFWGGFKDMDQDGIEDKFDFDKYHAEDFDGFKDFDGVPDYDNDEDGIADSNDKAPNEPEDIDGYLDEDGIPDPDNDGDGILDVNDKCPNTKEDFDQFEDNDGCPEFDNDNDSIPDSIDQCPNWPEDFNDYMDHDGCPDEKPAPPPYEKGEKIILKGIKFGSNSADLTTNSYTVLEEIVDQLLKFPEVAIEIRGYTDSLGDWNFNLLLSEKRAYAVKQYLISRGIAQERIRATGFGEQDPIAPNTTEAGRAANRRIEFERIE